MVKAGNAQKSKREKSKKDKSKKEKSKKKKSSLKDSKKKKIPKKLQKKQLVGGEMPTAKAIPSQESCNEKKSRQEVVGKSRMEKMEKSQFSKFGQFSFAASFDLTKEGEQLMHLVFIKIICAP